MSFLDALNLLMRRWLVVTVGLLLVAVAALVVLDRVDTQHQASSQMLFLLPPEASGIETPSNPYLNLQDGLTTMASLVAGTESSKDVERELTAAGFDSEYSIALVPGAGPLLLITTTDTDPGTALATRDELMTRVDDELERLQSEAEVPERQWISASRSNVSRRAEVLPGSKMRALAAVYGAGMLLVLLSAFAVDRLLARRRRRRALANDLQPAVSTEDAMPAQQTHPAAAEAAHPVVVAVEPAVAVAAAPDDDAPDDDALDDDAPDDAIEAASDEEEDPPAKEKLLAPVPLKNRNQHRLRLERERRAAGYDRRFDDARRETEGPGLAAGTSRQ